MKLPDRYGCFFEGANDIYVAAEVLRAHAKTFPPEDFERLEYWMDKVRPFKSAKGNLELMFEVARNRIPSLERLGPRASLLMVFDADDDPTGRWTMVRNFLGEHAANLPTIPTPAGAIARSPVADHLTVGIWMMPDNRSKGNLEDLLLDACMNSDALELARLATKSGQEFFGVGEPRASRLRSKATINCYKSFGKKPDRPYGDNLSSDGVFDPAAPALQPYADWLVRVLGI